MRILYAFVLNVSKFMNDVSRSINTISVSLILQISILCTYSYMTCSYASGITRYNIFMYI